jgi:TPP-dependent pyruvate/acetoin dehydrogenase alpha subunit
VYPKSVLLAFYRTMVVIRQCEESLVEFINSSEIKCPVHLYTGQEAVATGVIAALERHDVVFGNHRSHGHYLARTGDIHGMIAEVFCRETGCCGGRGGSMHLCNPEHGFLGAAPIVGGTIALAVGAALSFDVREEDRVAVSFFGDGATGEGVLYESINFAALKKLPVIFVCENNFYSTHMPLSECRAETDITESLKCFGAICHRVDGNDVLRVYQTAQSAVEHARSRRGPVFIECLTYRLRGHVGPDDNIQGQRTDIRPADEVKSWKQRDPIQRLGARLISQAVCTESDLNAITESVKTDVAQAIATVRRSNFPNPTEVYLHVFEAQS